MLLAALHSTKYSALVLSNKKEENYFDSDIKVIQYANQKDNINYLCQSKVMIVPVVKNHKGVCGVTSINDGLALNKPLLIANSCNLGFSAEEAGIGLTYIAGDLEDLKNKMRLILVPEVYNSIKKNMMKFLKDNEYSEFENLITDLITGENIC